MVVVVGGGGVTVAVAVVAIFDCFLPRPESQLTDR